MRRLLIPALTGLIGLAAAPAFAQTTLLNQLEQRLQGAAPGGISAAPATPAGGYLGAKFDDNVDPARGPHIKEVRTGTPAAGAGLKAGDYISAIDGKPTLNWTQFDAILDATKPGQKVELSIERNGQKQQLTATLGTPPPKPATTEPTPAAPSPTPSLGAPTTTPESTFPPATTSPSLLPPTSPSVLPGGTAPPATDTTTRPPLNLGPPPPETPADASPGGGFRATPGFGSSGQASLGIKVLPITDQAKTEFGFPVNRGALVVEVKPGSAAEAAGIPPNVLIVRMKSRPINSDDDLIKAVGLAQPGEEVELQYYDHSKLETKTVRLGAAPPPAPASSPSPSLGGVAPPGTTLPGRSYPGSPFGPTANPLAGAPPVGDSPLQLGGAGPGGGLLGRAERFAGNVARAAQGGVALGAGVPARGASTVYDPLQMAALQKAVDDLTNVVSSLEQRLKAIETKQGGGTSVPSSTPGFNPTATPGLGSPSAAGTNP